MTKQEKAIKALTKHVDKMTPEEQGRMEWFGDTETDKSYSWHYILDGHRVELAYGYLLKTITICGKGKI